MSKIIFEGEKGGIPFVRIGECGDFSVHKTFDCGQCFRFDEVKTEYKCAYGGVAFGKYVIFAQDMPDEITVIGSNAYDYVNIWEKYLSLDVDYDTINREIKSALPSPADAVMRAAAKESEGIRILRQEPFETLCSFIVSQNNNIPRIKKIIASMCKAYGEEISAPASADREFAFPTAKALANAGEEGIFALRTGFRAKYIYDCAEKVASGVLRLEDIFSFESYDECRQSLLTIKGVGEKVAACTLLFGFGRTEAFPIDVWIKRIIDNRFGGNLDYTLFGKNAGIAQQYLFYYERYAKRIS